MRLAAILDKEWSEMVKNRLLMFTVILPALILAAMPLLVLYLVSRAPNPSSQAEALYALQPTLRAFRPEELGQVMILNQFLTMFLLMPGIIPMTIAAFSIIGEKQSRSLEPLLATPVTVGELFAAKSIAAVVPAVLVTWVSYLMFAVCATRVLSPSLARLVWETRWLLVMGVIAPLFCVFSVDLGVIISARVNDTRVAQQIGGVIVLPVLALVILQVTGRLLLGTTHVVAGALVLAALNVALGWLGVRLFGRETILTRWS